jgi:hypothetical protein
MFYRAIFPSGNSDDKYFKDSELLFTVKTKLSFLGVKSICQIFKNENLIFSFSEKVFTRLFWELNILTQNLDKKVFIEKVNGKYVLIVDNRRIFLKFTNNPFTKKLSKIYLDGSLIGEINKKYDKSGTHFLFNFYENADLEYYVLILFTMYSVGIAGGD